jgi:hypothetical protein
MFQLSSVQELSHVVVTFVRAIVLLTPNGQFVDSVTAAFSELYQPKKQREAFTFCFSLYSSHKRFRLKCIYVQ